MSKNKHQKSLHEQAYQMLTNMQSFGRSKKEDKKNNDTQKRVYSFKTYDGYWKHIKYFVKYVRSTHPDCLTIKEARKYVVEWLKVREGQELSAWTIHLEAKALGKLYQIKPGDKDYFKPPVRRKEDIKRSRYEHPAQEKYFSEEDNEELVHFCQSVGARRSGIEKMKNDCLRTKNDIKKEISEIEKDDHVNNKENRLKALNDALLFKENWFVRLVEKGGKLRYAPIINNDQSVIDKIRSTPDYEYVWPYVNKNADIHSYRRDYAQELYKQYARDITTLPRFYYDKKGKHLSVYYPRGEYRDLYETKLDRHALSLVSLALGHGKDRVNVVVDNYL